MNEIEKNLDVSLSLIETCSLKAIFSQHDMCMPRDTLETSIWFVCVRDCYWNVNKAFLTTNFLFCLFLLFMKQRLFCTTLSNFDTRPETHAHWTGCFCIHKREAVMVYVCYYWSHMAIKVPNQFYLLEKKLWKLGLFTHAPPTLWKTYWKINI